jgi:hypothetical protein
MHLKKKCKNQAKNNKSVIKKGIKNQKNIEKYSYWVIDRLGNRSKN